MEEAVNDQSTEEVKQDQVESTEIQPPKEETQLFEVNGEQVSQDELIKGYMRQSDYTRKTQALAQERKSVESAPQKEINPEVADTVEALKTLGFTTKADIEAERTYQEDQRNLQRILNSNPDIRKFEGAIRKLGENSSEAWEDIIAKNNFKERGKIAKGGDVMGQPIPKTTKREKSVMSMTDKEYAEWKKRNNVTGSKF